MHSGRSRGSWQARGPVLAFPEGLGTTALVLPAGCHSVRALMCCASQHAPSCRSEAFGESRGGSAGEGQTWPMTSRAGLALDSP